MTPLMVQSSEGMKGGDIHIQMQKCAVGTEVGWAQGQQESVLAGRQFPCEGHSFQFL